MGDLTANFSRAEFACKCGCRFDRVDPFLVSALQAIRSVINMPIIILSGCRCVDHNAAVGGGIDSFHRHGQAADWQIQRLAIFDLFLLATSARAHRLQGIGLYPDRGFIHTDIRHTPTRWGEVRGKIVSFDVALGQARAKWRAIRDMQPSPEVPT